MKKLTKTQHSKHEDHDILSHHFMANRWGINGNSGRFYLGGFKVTVDSECSLEIKKMLNPWKKSYDKPRQHIKKQRHHFSNKGVYSQNYGFSNMDVRVGP